MATGWTVLPENIVNNGAFKDQRYLYMWLKLIIIAKKMEEFKKDCNFPDPNLRGVLSYSISGLAKELGCSRKTVINFLKTLEDNNLINLVKKDCLTETYATIKIVDYDQYIQGETMGTNNTNQETINFSKYENWMGNIAR